MTRRSAARAVLTDPGRMTPERVGGKFHKQSVMARRGIAVPEFLCLSGEFFEDVVRPLRESIARTLEAIDFTFTSDLGARLDSASAAIRSLIVTHGLSAEQRQILAQALDRVFPDGPLLSVRASMIGFRAEESEDSADNPFAGMSESFLYVRREEVEEKVLLAMASGFGAESILYRQKQGMDLLGFSVAVGVQRMVFGERSFVMFTCDPKTAARETVIIAGHGIGEGVVQERVAVDHYFFNPMTDGIRHQVEVKDRMLTFDRARGSGLTEREVPEDLRSRPCLSDEEIRSVAALGAKIERIFQAQQDIEGTFAADGSIHILQSRPVAMDGRRQRVWTNANVTESFPGVSSPLTFTLARSFYRIIFYDCYRLLGIPRSQLQDRYEQLDHMIGYLGGRVYYNLTSFYQLHRQSPLFPIFRAHWEKMMGFLASYEIRDQGLVERAFRRLAGIARLVKAAAVIVYRYLTHERDMVRFHQWWEGLIGPRRGRSFEEEDPIVLMTDFHEVWRQVGNRWGITLMNDTYLPVIYGWVEGLFRKWGLSGGDSGNGLLSGLLCGDDQLLSVEIILSAVRLSEHVRAQQDLIILFETESPEMIWARMEADELEPEFTAAVRHHLHAYGDRGFQELKMEQPSLRSTPWVLIKMIQAYVRDGLTVQAYREKEIAVRRDAEAELAHRLAAHPVRRWILKPLLAKLRRLIRNRENSRYCRSELFSYSKSVFLALGRTLVAQGQLRSIDDVYYLTMDELFGDFDGTGVTSNLQLLADLRRKEGEEHARRETRMQITTMGPVRRNTLYAPPPEMSTDRLLRGLGSSSGTVRGRARVVIDPNQPVDLGSDGILIARETDPGWLFLMLSSKGIVVERGSMLSHTAITGRKFGIPTVVSVAHATTRIADGAWIEVDGASGTVTLLDERELVQAAAAGLTDSRAQESAE